MGGRYSRWAMLLGALSVLTAPAYLVSGQAGRAASSALGDMLLGEWWTENNEGRIRFTRDRDGTFRGTTTCCTSEKASAEHPLRDIHNPNPKLRQRSTLGIVLIWKLAYEAGEYSGGYVYNPRDGETYRFAARMVDRNTVKIRGYMGIPLLGQSQIWKRAQPRAPLPEPVRGAVAR